MTPTLQLFLIISAALFSIGLLAALSRRHAIFVLIGIEMMLAAANLNFIAFWRFGPQPEAPTGVMVAIFSIAIAAAEAAVGLALVIAVYRHYRTTNVDQARSAQRMNVHWIVNSILADPGVCRSRLSLADSEPANARARRVPAALAIIGQVDRPHALASSLSADAADARLARLPQFHLVHFRRTRAPPRLGARSARRRHAGDDHVRRPLHFCLQRRLHGRATRTSPASSPISHFSPPRCSAWSSRTACSCFSSAGNWSASLPIC